MFYVEFPFDKKRFLLHIYLSLHFPEHIGTQNFKTLYADADIYLYSNGPRPMIAGNATLIK